MRGHIYKRQRKDGSIAWIAVSDLPAGPDGRRRQKSSTHSTRKEAERALSARIRAIETGTYREDDDTTVGSFLDTWLGSRSSLRPTTRRSYQHHIDSYILPQIGHLRLQGLRTGNLESMYAAIRSTTTLSSTSIRRIHATVRAGLNAAVRRGLIPANPAIHVELEPASSKPVSVWSPADVRRFLHVNRDDRLIALYQLLAFRGLRRGEALGLRWADVDLDAGSLVVVQQLIELTGGLVLGPPKTKTGTRTVTLDSETLRSLHLHRAVQLKERVALGQAWADTGLVFVRTDGMALRPSFITRHFQAMVQRADLNRIRLHDLRHTSASIGLEAGETLKEVSVRLGHSSIVVTADVYGHIAPELAKRSAEGLAQLIAESQR